MTKAKRIFGVIFASILLLMSVVVISLYDNVRENTPRDDNLTGILEDDLQLFTIAMAKTLDSNFEAVFQKHQPVMDMLHNMLIHGKTIIIFQLLRY